MQQPIPLDQDTTPPVAATNARPMLEAPLYSSDDLIDTWHHGREHERQEMIARSAAYSDAIVVREEQRKLNFRNTLQSIVAAMAENFPSHPDLIERIFLGYADSPRFLVLFFIKRGVFFSEQSDQVMMLIDTFCDRAETDFNLKIERRIAAECGIPDEWKLLSDGYTHYLLHGRGIGQ